MKTDLGEYISKGEINPYTIALLKEMKNVLNGNISRRNITHFDKKCKRS